MQLKRRSCCAVTKLTGFVFLFPLLASNLLTTASLQIGAFNIRMFGKSKVSKPEVMRVIVQIILRYDIVLIQEIRDLSGLAIKELIKNVTWKGYEYDYVISKRIGRTFSKEQYAFLYRCNRGLSVVASYHYNDSEQDAFEREPYVVQFSSTNTEITKFVLIGIHVDPDEAVNEINQLYTVHEEAYKQWGISDIIILGDLNADCRYVRKSHWPKIRLRRQMFYWPIDDSADTTVKSTTDCAYDRFVVTGKKLIDSIVPGSAAVFKFDRKFNLSESKALLISDHYPIELSLMESQYTNLTGCLPTVCVSDWKLVTIIPLLLWCFP